MKAERPGEGKAASREFLKRSLASSVFANFVQYTMPEYRMGWFHELVCNALDVFLARVARKESPRLILTAPPRHGKSELISRRFPAYVLGKHPDMTLICTSYAAALASRMNRDVQRVIDSQEYRQLFPGTCLADKGVADGQSYSRTTEFFEIVGRKGSYRSAGVGGGITGMGADCIIVDDPIASQAEAHSPIERQKVWDWFNTVLYTRCQPGAGIAIIHTRWHEDDLIGRLLEREKEDGFEGWEVINFPAIAERDEEFRKEGEPLFPEFFDIKALERIRKRQSSMDWSALYQQRPAPDDGQVFRREWFRYWTEPPRNLDKVMMSWDMTFKDTAGSDYVVGQVWGKRDAESFLLDQVRGRMGFVRTCQEVERLAAKWPAAYEKLVEDKANGPAVIDTLRKRLPGIIPIEPEGSKLARAHVVTAMLEAGNVRFPDPRQHPWVGELESELLSFPVGLHDDQVDALTQALRRMYLRPPIKINSALLTRGDARRPFGGRRV
jgi:predicted phage terminase large subunit-like protein